MTATLKKLGRIIPTDRACIRDHLSETVRRIVEDALNAVRSD